MEERGGVIKSFHFDYRLHRGREGVGVGVRPAYIEKGKTSVDKLY